jgi:DNA ligase-1
MDSIKPMLADAVTDLGKLHPNKVWAVEPKLDGIRCFAFVDPQHKAVTFQSRNGQPLPSLGKLTPILLQLAESVGKQLILDCEATAGADFFSGVGKLTQKAEATDLARLTVFDVPFVEGWGSSSEVPHSLRRECLETMFERAALTSEEEAKVSLVPVIDILTSQEVATQAEELLDDALRSGWEGLMLKDVDATYQSGRRCKAWIKLKPKLTFDCRVIGFKPGQGRLDGAAGALLVSHQGKSVAVASGLSDEQRQEIYDHPEKWVGKTVEVECQQLTPSGSMRHPSLVCVRWDK